jgi:hypothetical protein
VQTTERDSRADWARAGEALQRVLLTATSAGLAVALVAAVVEMPAIREELHRQLHLHTHPQLILRVGHATPS